MAQYGCPMTEPLHLVESVADIQNTFVLGGEFFQNQKQLIGFLRRQHRCRFIHNDEIRFLQQAADNFDPLSFADGQIGNCRGRVERKTIIGRHRFDALPQVFGLLFW